MTHIRGIGRAWIGEYHRIFRDRGALLVLVIAAVLYAMIYPLPYMHEVLRHVPIVVVDQDNTPQSRELARMVGATELVSVVAVVGSVSEARARVIDRTAGGAMVIPAGFARTLARGEQATVSALGDASYFLTYRQVATAVLTAAMTMSAKVEVRELVAGGASVGAAMAQRDPVPLITRMLYDPSSGYASYVVPAVLIIILQQTLLIGLGMLAGANREEARENGIDSPHASLMGRSLAYVVLYGIHILFFLSVIYEVYDFPQRGTLGTTFLFLLPFLLSVVFLGIAISNFFSERETAMQALLFTSLPSVFVAGFSWPSEMLPRWLNGVSWLLPSTAGVRGYLRVNQMGASLTDVWHEWIALWILTLAYFALAYFGIVRNNLRSGR